MNIEEFSYEFNSVGAENLISKLRQMEYETKQLDSSVSHLSKRFGSLFNLLLKSSVPPAFVKMIGDQAMAFSKQAAYLDKLSQVSGISAKNIQQLGYTLYKFGGDTDVATKSLTSLKDKIDQLKDLRRKGQEVFSDLFTIKRKFGLSLNGAEDPLTLLKQIAATMDKLSKDKQIKFAKALGLDDATFLMVKKGIKSVEDELYKAQKYVLFDEKDIATSVKFEDTIKEIGADIEVISKSFSFGALPQLQKFLNVIKEVTNYLSEHPALVKGIGLVTFSAGLTGLLQLLQAVPAKFIAGTAAVTTFGAAVGIANEELERYKEGDKEHSLLGQLEENNLKGTAQALYQIFSALSKFGEFKFSEGIKELDGFFDKIVEADTEGKDPFSNFIRSIREFQEELSQTKEEIENSLEEPLEKVGNVLDELIDEFDNSEFNKSINNIIDNISDYGSEVGETLSQSYKNIETSDFSSESIKTELGVLYDKTKAEIIRLSEISERAIIEEATSIYNTFKINFESIKNYLSKNSSQWIEDAKAATKSLYDKIKNTISSLYTEYTSNNESKDQQKISKVKDSAIDNIKAFFLKTLEVLTTAFHELPNWAQSAIKSGLKSFLVTWLLTGGNTKNASIVGSYMAINTALNERIKEGDENAKTYQEIVDSMSIGYAKNKVLSGGDDTMAAKGAMTAGVDEILEQLSKSKIKDDWKILKTISDHKSAIQAGTSVYAASSMMQHWGLSPKVANTAAVAIGGGEYLIDKGIEKIKDIFSKISNFLTKNEEAVNNLNTTLKNKETILNTANDYFGLNPNNPAFPISQAVSPLSNIQNDNIANSNNNVTINNIMNVSGGNPAEVQRAAQRGTESSLYRSLGMRGAADSVTLGSRN